ncbi:hypothetical protein [Spirosoma sordidisoli]|uniref:Uncharacterized protein n=1 Tax=Spirosoma sordidisoli TaxID=2502893 RepID=A0A4Q2USN5_9BACT|nr:hypothetical protein [Spirosoma sordidisoli]RYC70740.1 hypothetical protein EQG79_00880 [Spirosoma sordidisoli]
MRFCMAYGSRCQKRTECGAYQRYRTHPDRRQIAAVELGKACIVSNHAQQEPVKKFNPVKGSM